MNHDGSPRTPDVLLERYRLGEVSADERARIEASLSSEPGLQERLGRLAEDDQLARPAAAALADAVRGRLEPAARAASGVPLPALAASLACLAVLALTLIRDPGPANEDTRTKGALAGLAVHRKTRNGSEALADGARARAGDLLQLGYRAGGGYGVILSLDGRGRITQHLPAEGGAAVELAPGRLVLLDFAYQLDDAPRFERFYLVTADAPFDVARVRSALDAARQHAPGPPDRIGLPPGFQQFLFTLDKESDR
jgi:hypothetical protein